MAMPAWIPEAWAELSEDDQKLVGDYMQFLLSKGKPVESIDTSSIKPLHYGVFKGKIYVSENFDDPLPEFSDYM